MEELALEMSLRLGRSLGVQHVTCDVLIPSMHEVLRSTPSTKKKKKKKRKKKEKKTQWI
jgi:hypothetical protein